MIITGIQGSPRNKGNTNFLLSLFMNECKSLGATTRIIEINQSIIPCKECGACENKGFCPTDDYMSKEVYGLFRDADAVVLATPVFFYNTPAQLKSLIDRSQALWARKYRLKLDEPCKNHRKGFLLSVGATKGKNLFDGINLTAKYFFDAISANFHGELTY
ncbi:MAG: flavodoxin family protein, partial [Desulfobacterales bacterium]|nr:flavodoxin family protein [Desulfobacterales bacterium]